MLGLKRTEGYVDTPDPNLPPQGYIVTSGLYGINVGCTPPECTPVTKIDLFGGGGGGSSVTYPVQVLPGGGGGSGHWVSGELPSNTKYLSIVVGKGGLSNKDGSGTTVQILDVNKSIIQTMVAPGGKAGTPGTALGGSAGAGGDGLCGGGGGAGYGDFGVPGQGGNGIIPQNHGGNGGQATDPFPPYGYGGCGGGTSAPYSGGGGGGPGGGNGGLNGAGGDATGFTGAGGGGAAFQNPTVNPGTPKITYYDGGWGATGSVVLG
jgi:hypothetical protein